MDLSWSLEKICFVTCQCAACFLEVNVSNSGEDLQPGAELANLDSWGGGEPTIPFLILNTERSPFPLPPKEECLDSAHQWTVVCEKTFYVTIESENEIQSNEKQKGWRAKCKPLTIFLREA